MYTYNKTKKPKQYTESTAAIVYYIPTPFKEDLAGMLLCFYVFFPRSTKSSFGS